MTDIADTRRLLELTSSDGGGEVDQRTDDAIDEIVSLLDRRAPRLLDGQEVYAILLAYLVDVLSLVQAHPVDGPQFAPRRGRARCRVIVKIDCHSPESRQRGCDTLYAS